MYIESYNGSACSCTTVDVEEAAASTVDNAKIYTCICIIYVVPLSTE